MKKIISLLLVLALCLSLCACDSGVEEPIISETEPSATAYTDASAETEAEEPAFQQTVLQLNETIAMGDLELTIIDVQLMDSSGYSVYYSTGARHYGGPSVVVIYSLKNIGKLSAYPPTGLLQLNYADGYTFLHDVYINGRDSDIYAHGGVNLPEELEILSPEQYYLEAFTVPQEVLDNTEEPLYFS